MHAYALEWLWESLSKKRDEDDGRRTILDVGCGSGYLVACLAKLSEGRRYRVFGIDHVKELVDLSKRNVSKGNPDITERTTILLRDGFKGLEEEGPFDAIHVGAAAPVLPKTLVSQLRPGGRMIIPVGTDEQKIYAVDKKLDGGVEMIPLLDVRYIPLTTPERQLERDA